MLIINNTVHNTYSFAQHLMRCAAPLCKVAGIAQFWTKYLDYEACVGGSLKCLHFLCNVKVSNWIPWRLSCSGVNTVQCSAVWIVSYLFALAVGRTEMCMLSTIPLLFVLVLLRTGDSCSCHLLFSISHKHSIVHWGFISSNTVNAIKIPIVFSYVLATYRHFTMAFCCNIYGSFSNPIYSWTWRLHCK